MKTIISKIDINNIENTAFVLGINTSAIEETTPSPNIIVAQVTGFLTLLCNLSFKN